MLGVVAAFGVVSLAPEPSDGPKIVTPVQPVEQERNLNPGQAGADDCCRSQITQDLVDRNPLPGGGFEIVIEATLDSNAVCHVLLLQCVVEPELAPANMTLQSVECLSPRWVNINITLPVVGDVDVCARFDANRAGQDQKFRFTYTTPLDTGSVSETVEFFRFPEEIFFIRAENTITIDLPNEADILEECPDIAEIGTQITCTTRVEVLAGSVVAAANVVRTSPAELVNGTLTSDQAGWVCAALTCTYTDNGGTLPEGVYTFTATSDVVGPVADVEDCSAINTGATEIASDCDLVTIFAASDTFAALEMGADRATAPPGAPVVWTVTFTNDGDNPLDGARMVNDTARLVIDLSISHVAGAGAWTCGAPGGTPICDLAPGASIPVGGSAIFEIRGSVVTTAVAGDVVVSEVEATYANDPFGPAFPLRDGTTIEVVVEPTFTG
jgi:hypothetical protein